MQLARSVIFLAQMYFIMALMAIFFVPWAMVDRRGAFAAVRTYTQWVRWTAHWIVGLQSEIRGQIPTGNVIIAAKHQSFFDVILITSVLSHPRFIMKSELRWVPFVGYYAKRIGCIAIDRNKGFASVKHMLKALSYGDTKQTPNDQKSIGQVVIYPQGTRLAPGVMKSYGVGVAALYAQMNLNCVPTATNVGYFWPRRGILRKSGLAVVEFLPVIPKGLPKKDFMATVEARIECASDGLLRKT